MTFKPIGRHVVERDRDNSIVVLGDLPVYVSDQLATMLLELVNRSIQMTELERGAAVEKGISPRPLPELRVGYQASCRNHVERGVGNVNGGAVRLLQIP